MQAKTASSITILITLVLWSAADLAAQADGRSTYHLFPQLAYGQFTDGWSLQSTVLISNPTGGPRRTAPLAVHPLR